MWSCKWIPTTQTVIPTSKIRIYDAGVYVGFLYNDTWRCWHITSREKIQGGYIIESLMEMPPDWIPFRVYSEEEYPLQILQEDSHRFELLLPGWLLQGGLVTRAEEHPEEPPCLLNQEYLKPETENRIHFAGHNLFFAIDTFESCNKKHNIKDLLHFTEEFISRQIDDFDNWAEEVCLAIPDEEEIGDPA